MPQRAPRPDDKKEFEVYQTRGPGHSRIMGKIEYDIRTLLRIADVPADKAFLLLACSAKCTPDIENNKKPDTLLAALDSTTDRWVARGFDSEMIERIRAKVTDIFNSLKAQKPAAPPPPPVTAQDEPPGDLRRARGSGNRRKPMARMVIVCNAGATASGKTVLPGVNPSF